MNFKPMLASQIDDLSSVKYPVYASYKLDGIRAIIYQGVAYSRSLKPIAELTGGAKRRPG